MLKSVRTNVVEHSQTERTCRCAGEFLYKKLFVTTIFRQNCLFTIYITATANSILYFSIELATTKHEVKLFKLQFQGLNVEKERLTTKVAKQTKFIEHLRRCELAKAKKLFKYAKYFSENDENIPVEVKEMLEEGHRQKRLFEEKSDLTKTDSINQATEERKYVENSTHTSEDVLKGNLNFWASLDKHIEQNNMNKQLISALLKEAKLLADKDLEIWNKNKELQQTENILAKFIVDLSISRAQCQIEKQKMIQDRGKSHRSCCYSVDHREQESKMMTIQQSLSLKDQIARLQSDARSGQSAENMKVKLTDMKLKSKVLDGTVFEPAYETREQTICYEDFTKIVCMPERKCKTQGVEKGKKKSAKEAGSTGKVGRRFLDRILRKRRRVCETGVQKH